MVEHNGKEYTLQEAIELFLSEPRKSDGGDWAKPTTDDIDLMYEIVYELIEQKFERDCDGDLPIKYHILDRTEYQPLWYVNIPHTPLYGGTDKRLQAVEMYSSLVRHYSERLDCEIRGMKLDKEDRTK